MKSPILIIDDDSSILEALHEYFKTDYEVYTASGGREGVSAFNKTLPAAVILDLRMPDMGGMEVLEEIKSADSNVPVIMLTAYGEIEDAVKAIQYGSEHFLTKPVDLQTLNSMLEKSINTARLHKNYQYMLKSFNHLREKLILHPHTWNAVNLMSQNPDITVLITGPTGAGKRVVAELIHRESSRKDAPFVDINCAGLSEGLLESELFGHERGAFTDAKTKKKGLMEIAHGGTLFLDEIGEMPLSVQAKILNAIENKSFRQIGGTENLKVDTRIIAATNADLVSRIKKGRFREDLYYRLNVIPVKLPPLKERKEDIPELIALFLKEFAAKTNKPVQDFTDDAISLLMDYSWPGNIRELKNIIERAVMLCESNRISIYHLPRELRKNIYNSAPHYETSLMTLEEAEKRQIALTLEYTKNNKSEAARILGIHVSTLARKIKAYNLTNE